MSFQSTWQTFIANYKWSDRVTFIDGWIPKFSLGVPVIGYLLLFNDQIVDIFKFDTITDEMATGLSAVQRLRFVYFGFILLGLSNFIYRLKRPFIFKFGNNLVDFTKICLETMSYSNFLHWHQTIRSEGHVTTDGKYYDSEWEGFVIAANNKGEGTENVKRNGNWEDAKRQYGSLLRSILAETFSRNDITNRFWLTVCMSLSTIGYVLLIIPSGDIFLKVIKATFGI